MSPYKDKRNISRPFRNVGNKINKTRPYFPQTDRGITYESALKEQRTRRLSGGITSNAAAFAFEDEQDDFAPPEAVEFIEATPRSTSFPGLVPTPTIGSESGEAGARQAGGATSTVGGEITFTEGDHEGGHRLWPFHSPSLSRIPSRRLSQSSSLSASTATSLATSDSPPSRNAPTPTPPGPTTPPRLIGGGSQSSPGRFLSAFRMRRGAGPELIETAPTPPSNASARHFRPESRRRFVPPSADSPTSHRTRESGKGVPDLFPDEFGLLAPELDEAVDYPVQRSPRRLGHSLPLPSTSTQSSPENRRYSMPLPAATLSASPLSFPPPPLSRAPTFHRPHPRHSSYRSHPLPDHPHHTSHPHSLPAPPLPLPPPSATPSRLSTSASSTTLFSYDLAHLPAPSTPREKPYKVSPLALLLPTIFLGGGRYSGKYGDTHGAIERRSEEPTVRRRSSGMGIVREGDGDEEGDELAGKLARAFRRRSATVRRSLGSWRGRSSVFGEEDEQGGGRGEELDEWVAIVVE